jgi:hypothetical protein
MDDLQRENLEKKSPEMLLLLALSKDYESMRLFFIRDPVD